MNPIMKTTNFAKYLTDFLTVYLTGERGASGNTIKSYRDTFIRFIGYINHIENIKINEITLSAITRNRVVAFLDWIQKEKKHGASTRNNRLAAIHSFIKYVQYRHPDNIYEFQRILSIKSKPHERGKINYLSLDGIKLLLSMPDTRTQKSRRDLALLSVMYDVGARVQEVADLTVQDIHREKPYYVTIRGKGMKIRTVPMVQLQMDILLSYMEENGLMKSECRPYPLFTNNRKEKLTRGGITHIVKKYAAMARAENNEIISGSICCHSLRHSKAMHLLQAGVNLVYIRDILGHVSIQTTEIYARADSKQKREAIEKAYNNVSPEISPLWERDEDMLSWLKSF
jgi:site-specific recombinase XerD